MDQNHIILTGSAPEEDRDWAEEEHVVLFDHYPDNGPDGRCRHPIHDEMRRVIDAPGVSAEVQFDPNVIVSTDSAGVIDAVRRYDDQVDRYRGFIANIEEKQAYLDARDATRPLRRREREQARNIAKTARKSGILEG